MTGLHLRRRLLVTAGWIAGVWLGGLLLFVIVVGEMKVPRDATAPQHTDAIIVLTGGSERIDTGLTLLKQGHAARLFISGVGEGTNLPQLDNAVTLPDELAKCCVTLGHKAADTIGNATESATWLDATQSASVRLVTAHYHMLRSLLEFRMLRPDLLIVAHPVAPARVQLDGWWTRKGTARLLVTEYNKLLVTLWRYALHWRPQ